MKKRLLLILSCLFLSIGFVVAQTTKASGVVLDDTGETLPGVAVVVQGTTTGTITDGDGRFTINVPTGKKVLVFSLLGMQKLEASAADNMKITLMPDDATALDEVMVVAYGTAKKSAFTGSAGVVKTEDIVNRQTSNVVNALAGQVAGVQMSSANGQPGVASTVRIRGIGSMSASNAPLYVVDGTPFAGDISSINPNDVESMTVLKDAASNALYGSRGANGVILITTKTGTTAEARVTVDAKWGTNRRQVPNYKVLKSPATYYEKVYEAMYNSQYYKGQTADASHTYTLGNIFTNSGGGTGYRVYDYPTGEDFILKGGKINPNATLGYTIDGYYMTPDNWYDEAFDSGNLRQEYNISISGRSDKTNYFFSAGYLDDTGLIKSSGLDRFTTRLKVDYQAKKWLKLGVNMSYTNLKNNYPSNQTSNGSSGNVFYVANNIAPIYPLYMRNSEGEIMEDRRGYTMYDYGEKANGFPYQRNFMNQSNPVSALQLDTREYKMDIFSGRWYAQADIIEGLRAIANIGIDIDNTRYKRANNPYYGQYKGSSGYVYVSSDQDKTINYQYRMTYNKSINLHNFDVMVGYDGMDRDISALSGQKEGMYNPDITELGNVINKPNTDSSIDKYSVASFIGRVQYDFADEFFGSASFTHQATSRFAKGNRWGDFWSIGGAWQINRKVLKDVKWVKLLKYKLSYGTQGNDNILYRDGVTQNYYAYASQSTISNLNGTWSVPLSYVGNKDISWEKSSNVNTGIDFDIFNGKLSGSVEYFYRKTKDLLYFRPSTPSGGYGFYPVNVGSMVNKGFEFNFNSEFIKTKDLSIGANVNLTYLSNKIDKLSPELNGQLIDGSRIYKEGKAYYNYYLRSYAGVDEKGVALYYQDVLDVNNNPTGERVTTTDWQKATQYETGDLLADVYGGFGVYANFKGIDFSMAFTYQLGGTVYDNSYAALMHGGSSANAGQNWHKDILNSWSDTNPNTNIPRVNSTDSYTNSTSDRFLKSSDYLNFQNVTLGYTLPASLTKKLNISSVRFYGVVDNLWLLTARKGLDPRNALGGAVTSGATYSAIRSFSGGLSLTF